jgi:hypothetical protein
MSGEGVAYCASSMRNGVKGLRSIWVVNILLLLTFNVIYIYIYI